jgi:hypothetical protein
MGWVIYQNPPTEVRFKTIEAIPNKQNTYESFYRNRQLGALRLISIQKLFVSIWSNHMLTIDISQCQLKSYNKDREMNF